MPDNIFNQDLKNGTGDLNPLLMKTNKTTQSIDKVIHVIEAFYFLQQRMRKVIHGSGYSIYKITKALGYSQTYLYHRMKAGDFTPKDIKEILFFFKKNSRETKAVEDVNKKSAPALLRAPNAIHAVEAFYSLQKQMRTLIGNSGYSVYKITKALGYSQTYLYHRMKAGDFTPKDVKEILYYIKRNSLPDRFTQIRKKETKAEEDAHKKTPPILLCAQNDAEQTMELFIVGKRFFTLKNIKTVKEISEAEAVELYADKKNRLINTTPPGEFFPSLEIAPAKRLSYQCATKKLSFVFEIKNDIAQIHSVKNLK
ncbi:MAG: hypothetical protein CRN43_01010, partial [Candidatus Nephrothrix sp. EaCA]